MSWTRERSRLARLHQTHSPDSPEILEAQASFKAARLQDQVAKALESAPPLTDEQRERIAGLLLTDRPQARHADLGLADDTDTAGGEVG
jgi:hypothetical protein